MQAEFCLKAKEVMGSDGVAGLFGGKYGDGDGTLNMAGGSELLV